MSSRADPSEGKKTLDQMWADMKAEVELQWRAEERAEQRRLAARSPEEVQRDLIRDRRRAKKAAFMAEWQKYLDTMPPPTRHYWPGCNGSDSEDERPEMSDGAENWLLTEEEDSKATFDWGEFSEEGSEDSRETISGSEAEEREDEEGLAEDGRASSLDADDEEEGDGDVESELEKDESCAGDNISEMERQLQELKEEIACKKAESRRRRGDEEREDNDERRRTSLDVSTRKAMEPKR